MATQSQFYNIGSGRTFPSTKHIATKQNMAIFVKEPITDVWTQLNVSDFELINNSAVVNADYVLSGFDQLEVRVADTYDELLTSDDDISIVVGIEEEIKKVAFIDDSVVIVADNILQVKTVSDNIVDVRTVADDLDLEYSNIEHAKENGDIALASATSALDSEVMSEKWAINPEDVPVEGSGSSSEYSALHWAAKAKEYGRALVLQGEFTPVMGVEYPTGSMDAGFFWIISGVDLTLGYTFAGGDLAGQTAENGDWIIWDGGTWILTETQIDAESYYRRDGTLPMQADVECDGNKVADMADGILDTDGTTLGQVNAKIVIGSYGSRR